MRVIAGTFRSRPLAAPSGIATRPTSDRLRETLFNILAPRLPAARFADLYAGSGAVGIEALSRGAAHVLFAEKAPPALAAIRANLHNLGIAQNVIIDSRGVASLLHALAAGSTRHPALDIVFLDPPWEAAAEYAATLSALGASTHSAILAPGALVVAEHAARAPLPAAVGSLHRTRTLKQGDAALSFYEILAPAPDAPAANAPPV